jgi:pimeloyl-ACP methyl ester carboxylesterase
MLIQARSLPTLAERLQCFEPQRLTTATGEMEFRRAGSQTITHVLLHGIGSGSASWLRQLEAAAPAKDVGLLAWEAPGYGNSQAVKPDQPDAGDYASRLWAWLDALKVSKPITLVGHSLGALMAARAAVQRPTQVARLVLLSPAQGYARASAAERQKKLDERLSALDTLGIHGMALKRGAAMLSPSAAPEVVQYVQMVMGRLNPPGYRQAVHLLMSGDLLTDVTQVVARASYPITVASGDLDTITPPAACQNVAAAAGVPWVSLGAAGHACALDAAGKINALLDLESVA